MDEPFSPQNAGSAAARFIRPRSQGTKFMIVCLLALLMSIPALFVFMLLSERTERANKVTTEIGDLMGGEQTYLGPVIVVPYTVPAKAFKSPAGATTTTSEISGELVVFPVTGKAEASSVSEVRARSLFRVPVYTSNVHFTADFDLSAVAAQSVSGSILHWDRASVMTAISDSRGARKDIVVKSGSQTLTLSPLIRDGATEGSMAYFSAPMSGVNSGSKLSLEADMSFSGAKRIGILAFAKSTEVSIAGDWNYPSFGGSFLPTERAFHHDASTPLLKGETNLTKGFKATWNIPFIARGLPNVIEMASLTQLNKSELSVTFVEPTNPYQSVSRSLKYAMLFVGIVFLAYFLFESTSKTELHPAQYILVGLAQMTFYLLLLSFAERIGFDAAFVVASAATVILISAYVWMIFKNRTKGLIAFGTFSVLYGLIYLLMRTEDLALLVGSIAAFVILAAVMVMTRNINWYGKEQA